MSQKRAEASEAVTRSSRSRRPVLALVAIATGCGLALPAVADVELARARNCMACHTVEKSVVGPFPSMKAIAVRYAKDRNAVPKLVKKVVDGGGGVWGSEDMPPNPQVSSEEAGRLVRWILDLKVAK